METNLSRPALFNIHEAQIINSNHFEIDLRPFMNPCREIMLEPGLRGARTPCHG